MTKNIEDRNLREAHKARDTGYMKEFIFLYIIIGSFFIGSINETFTRWPRSIHSQVEAVFHSIRAFGQSKKLNPKEIRSLGSWNVYRYEAHKFAEYLIIHNCHNILDTPLVKALMSDYLHKKFKEFHEKGLSRQTMETMLAALAKFEYALNTYIKKYKLSVPEIDAKEIRQCISKKTRDKKLGLSKTSREYFNRAYPDPNSLIDHIDNPIHRLQAMLQREGGLRAEGIGAPSSGHHNPLTIDHLGGIVTDPITGEEVGLIKNVVEKGGKKTDHMVSVRTYRLLEAYITKNGKLESVYREYVLSLAKAAKATGQYDPGRGTHALKHNFAQNRYLECVKHGLTHEQALQQTSLELAHFRYYETFTYTRG